MKRFSLSLIAAVALFISLANGQGNKGPRFTEEKLKQIEQNLVRSLESDIRGVRLTAAKTVWDLKTRVPQYEFGHRTTVALMRIVKDEAADNQSRIVAAIALSRLDSELGNYAIKMQAQFAQSERVKHICNWLTYNRAEEQRLARATTSAASKTIATK